MNQCLPRVIEVKLADEPRRSFLFVDGVEDLAAMVRLPAGLPKGAVAHQFLSDFNRGKLRPKPALFTARVHLTVKL
jgi:hypothetical protein